MGYNSVADNIGPSFV